MTDTLGEDRLLQRFLAWILGPRWFVEAADGPSRGTVVVRARSAFDAMWKGLERLQGDPRVGYSCWKRLNNLQMSDDERVRVQKVGTTTWEET